ncbi:MAG: hypothetical protein ACTSSJ_04010 [Candidatus Odinarchaeia archaeon]
MMSGESLIRWLKGADEIFDALEGRGDAYNLCRRWVEEWFTSKKFCITEEDERFLNEFDLLVFNENVKSKIKLNLEQFKRKINQYRDKLAFAFSLYLISWNIRRFEKYFEINPDFSFGNFFTALNEVFNKELLEDIKKLRGSHLFKCEIEERLIASVFERLNQKLKQIGAGTQNEPVATIKILHIIAPYHIPLLDNPIAKALKKERVCEFFPYRMGKYRGIEINKSSLVKYMKWIKNKFSAFSHLIFSLEREMNKSFLKLLDQAFYIRYSIDIGRRLK